jgi:hypothetical protein
MFSIPFLAYLFSSPGLNRQALQKRPPSKFVFVVPPMGTERHSKNKKAMGDLPMAIVNDLIELSVSRR